MYAEIKPGDAYRMAVEAPDAGRLQTTSRHFKSLRRMIGFQMDQFRPGQYSSLLSPQELWSLATHLTHKLDVRSRLDDPEQLAEGTKRMIDVLKPPIPSYGITGEEIV